MEGTNVHARQRLTAAGRALSCVLACAVLAGCTSEATTSRTSGVAGTPNASGDDATLATLSGTPVTLLDLRERVGERLDQLDNQYQQRRHELIEQTLKQVLDDRLLEEEAEARGLSVDELIAAEVEGKSEVTDEEVTVWYEQNEERLQGRSLEEVYPSIEQLLLRSKQDELREELIRRLREERRVVVYLEPYRVQFDNESVPALGPATAPITLVEFSDFECPYCVRFFPTIGRLEETYGDQLRIVYRQFPLTSIHRSAFKAAEASLCAHDQGRFWEMHDLLFEQQDQLGVEALKAAAGTLELDQTEFDECLDSDRHAEQVRRDLSEGRVAGVSGTPALFVNGIRVPGGAVPYEVVAAVIDEELERIASK